MIPQLLVGQDAGAWDGNRTRKPAKARDFKSRVFTNFTTQASKVSILPEQVPRVICA